MRLHRLLRLDDNKFAASCETGLMQVDCQDFICLDVVVVLPTSMQQVCKHQVASNLIFTDLVQLTSSLWPFWLCNAQPLISTSVNKPPEGRGQGISR